MSTTETRSRGLAPIEEIRFIGIAPFSAEEGVAEAMEKRSRQKLPRTLHAVAR